MTRHSGSVLGFPTANGFSCTHKLNHFHRVTSVSVCNSRAKYHRLEDLKKKKKQQKLASHGSVNCWHADMSWFCWRPSMCVCLKMNNFWLCPSVAQKKKRDLRESISFHYSRNWGAQDQGNRKVSCLLTTDFCPRWWFNAASTGIQMVHPSVVKRSWQKRTNFFYGLLLGRLQIPSMKEEP